MKFLRQLSLIGLTVILFSSCAKIFYSPDAFTLAHSHKVVAILPPAVSIIYRKKDNLETLKKQESAASQDFQKEMHAWFLKRKMQGKITNEIQDIETTNAKLANAGYPEKYMTPEEMAEVLGVDGVMISNYTLSKPMSAGAAIALGVLVGMYGPTNEVQVTLSIHDKANKKLLWNYNHTFSGSVGSSPNRLVNAIMRHASKKMPYVR